MSLTTLRSLKIHDQDYNNHRLSGTVSVKNAIKAIAADYHGAALYPWAGDAAESVALERGRPQLSNDPTPVFNLLHIWRWY